MSNLSRPEGSTGNHLAPSTVSLHPPHREEPEPEGGVSAEERGGEGIGSHDGPAVHASGVPPQPDGPSQPHGAPLIARRRHHHVRKKPSNLHHADAQRTPPPPVISDAAAPLIPIKGDPRSVQMSLDFGRGSGPLRRAATQWNNHLPTPQNRLLTLCLKFSCDRQMHCKLQMFCTYSILYIY